MGNPAPRQAARLSSKVALHSISAWNALRMDCSIPFEQISSVRNQTDLPVPSQFTFARKLQGRVSVSPRDQ